MIIVNVWQRKNIKNIVLNICQLAKIWFIVVTQTDNLKFEFRLSSLIWNGGVNNNKNFKLTTTIFIHSKFCKTTKLVINLEFQVEVSSYVYNFCIHFEPNYVCRGWSYFACAIYKQSRSQLIKFLSFSETNPIDPFHGATKYSIHRNLTTRRSS